MEFVSQCERGFNYDYIVFWIYDYRREHELIFVCTIGFSNRQESWPRSSVFSIGTHLPASVGKGINFCSVEVVVKISNKKFFQEVLGDGK